MTLHYLVSPPVPVIYFYPGSIVISVKFRLDRETDGGNLPSPPMPYCCWGCSACPLIASPLGQIHTPQQFYQRVCHITYLAWMKAQGNEQYFSSCQHTFTSSLIKQKPEQQIETIWTACTNTATARGVKTFLPVAGGAGSETLGGLCAVAVTGKSHEGKGLMFVHLDPMCRAWWRDNLGSKTNKICSTAFTTMLY